MPTYRSVTLSILSQSELKQHPEFSHPESSQFHFRGPTQLQEIRQDGSLQRSPGSTMKSSISSSSVVSKSDKVLGKSPSIAVYIPSLPGTRFFIKYSITPPFPDGQLMYFKLFMNGRHMNSWGVNPRTKPKGQVVRALFEADKTWDFTDRKGAILKRGGAESRPFYFAENEDNVNAASDGGLIEIKVFRSSGRRRRPHELDIFRPQKEYGITCPSLGLLDNPQYARFFDWLLIDPKDAPYATFRFHYRSWDHLESLQLIPSSHPRILLPINDDFSYGADTFDLDMNMPSKLECEVKRQEYDSEEETSSFLDESAPWAAAVSTLRRMPVEFEGTEGKEATPSSQAEQLESHVSKSPSPRLRRVPVSTFSIPHADLNNWEQDRPLPELPNRKDSASYEPRKSFESSYAPSITPSLLPWLDRESENPSPEPILGVASMVAVLRSPDQSNQGSESSFSTVGNLAPSVSPSPSSTLTNNRFSIAPPPEGIFLPPNSSNKKLRQGRRAAMFSNESLRIDLEDDDAEDADDDDPFHNASFNSSGAKSTSRSRIPEPVKRDSDHIPPSNLWSPIANTAQQEAEKSSKSKGKERLWLLDDENKMNHKPGTNEGGKNLVLPTLSKLNREAKHRSADWI